MLTREGGAGQVGASVSSVMHSEASSHLRQELTFLHSLSGSSLPLEERKTGLRCKRGNRTGLMGLQGELLICVTSGGQGRDGRNLKRRLGGDIVAQDSSPGKLEVREGLRLLHSPPEGLRRKKGNVSRIASADVPLTLGSDVGNKRRRRVPEVYKESGGGHIEKEGKASQSSNGQTEENERRSERLKERREQETKKNLEESQAIHWEFQFPSARRKKSSSRRLQQKGNRGKSKVQGQKQVRRSWPLDREKGISSVSTQGHDEQGGLTWTSRLRERGKKRVLEFCAEVEVEAFAPDKRVVKQKVEKANETLGSNSEQIAEELDVLFVRSWTRKHPRNLRTRARFQTLPKQETQAGVSRDAGGTEEDHLPSSSEEKQLGVRLADATAMKSSKTKETELPSEDACHVKEHVNSAVQGSASKSSRARFQASSAQESSAVKVQAEHTVQPDVPSGPSENGKAEGSVVESEKQIEIVLDLGLQPSTEGVDSEPITVNGNFSSSERVSNPPTEQMAGFLKRASPGNPPFRMRASAACERAEAPGASAEGVSTVRIGSSLTSMNEVLEIREHQTCDEIARAMVLGGALSRSYTEFVTKKLIVVEEHLDCNEIAEEKQLESRDLKAGSKFPKKIIVNVGDVKICKQTNYEVVEVRELSATVEDTNRKVVKGTKPVRETGGEYRGCSELIERSELEVRDDRISSEAVTEKVVVPDRAVFSERTGQDSDSRICNAKVGEKVPAVRELTFCNEIEDEKVLKVRDNLGGNEIAGHTVHEGQEHVVDTKVAKEEKKLESLQQKVCNETSNVKELAVEDPTVCQKLAQEQELEVTQHKSRCEIYEELMVEAEKDSSVSDRVVHADTVRYAEVKVLDGLEHRKNLSLESGDESASGNSEEDISGSTAKEVPRGAADSAGNSVDDFDVLAKYCRVNARKNRFCKIVENPESIVLISEDAICEYDNLEQAEVSDKDPDPNSLKASTSTGRSEPAEENGSEDQEEIEATRLQSLLDVVRIEVDATPELGESSDCREMGVSVEPPMNVRRTEELHSQNAFLKERAAKYSNDFKRGFVSLGLKCALCGGSSDGKWACERSARKIKVREVSNYGLPKLSKSDVKECGKLQVKKGWLGRLLGPLSERVGVAGAWVHEECAVWSPEVYFAGVGRLKNVKAAIRRGRLLKCSHCGQPGATIGCRVDRCPQNYHLPCAHFDGCSFDHKKYLVACADHLHLFPSRCRRFLEHGNDVQVSGSGHMKDSSKLHRGNFRRMMIERRAAASTARLKDLEEEEKCMEKSGEDEEFVRRERKRLQRDLARIVPTKLGGRKTDSVDVNIPEGWNSVAGLQDVVECLKEMVILPLLYPGAFDRLAIVPPRGVLLHGHSGTGKTLVVRALAGACARGSQKISYFARKGADCLGKYVGDAERQLRLLFQVAEQHQPSIIFFDEIDGLAPSRSRDGQDQTHSSVVSTLLALMDGLSSRGSVIVIGATNRPDALDPALRRPGRFDREIYFPLPSAADRAAILALHTRSWVPRPSGEVLSAVARATRGFAGADLRALCVEVALKALKRVAPIHRLMEFAERGHIGDGLPQLPMIEVRASDWASALKEAPPPCSMRMTSAALSYIPGSPLPWYLVPSLLPALVEVLLQLHCDGRCPMPPALFKAVSFIDLQFQSFAGNSELSEPRSQFKWMDLLQSGGHTLVKSVEAALSSAGLVGSSEGLSDSGHLKPPYGEALPCKPSVLDTDSSASVPKYLMHGGWRRGHFRVLISGKGKRGQRLVAASIIAGFEGFRETRTLNLPTMLHEGDGDVIQGLNRILGAGKGSTPCMLFMPQVESWSMVREEVGDESPREFKTSCVNDARNFGHEALSEEALRSDVVAGGNSLATVSSSTWNVFLQHIKCLSPDSSIMFLATSHFPLNELPSKVVEFFGGATTKCKEEHVLSKSQPVPCALVELPPLREHIAVVERASQDISRSLTGRLVRFLNHVQESVNTCHPTAISGLADSTLLSEETPEVESRDGSFDDGNECLLDTECDEPGEQLSPLVVSDMPEQPGLSPCLPDFTLKPEGCGRSLQDCPAPLFAPQILPRSWSSEQRALQFAIAQLSHQILNQAQFSDLRRISARILAGPCLSTSLIDQRILGTPNHYRSMSFPGEIRPFEDRLDRRDDKHLHASHVYGLVAIGLKGKSGFYSSGTQIVSDVTSVLKVLRERVKSKVESGKEYLVYVPLLSKVSGLEDIVRSWSYQTRRLEAAARVVDDVQSIAPATNGREDASQLGSCEAHEARVLLPPQTSEHLSFQDAVTTQSYGGNNGDAVTHSHTRDVGSSGEGSNTAPLLSDKLAAEKTTVSESLHRDSQRDPCSFDAKAHLQASRENHVMPDDVTNVDGPAVERPEDVACQLPSQKIQPKKRRMFLKSESLLPLSSAIRKMILAVWKERSAESVELLYEIIPSCAASIRVVSDKLIREVQWTSDCKGEVPCTVGSDHTPGVVDAVLKEVCLCPLTEAVRELTHKRSEEAVDLYET